MATNGDRVEHRDEVIALLERAFADIAAEDLLARLNKVGIPAGKVRTIDEVYGWDQALSQGLLVDVEHATLGPAVAARAAAAVLRRPARTARPRRPGATHAAPPVLGADGDAIRAWLAAADGVPQPAGDDVEDGHAT